MADPEIEQTARLLASHALLLLAAGVMALAVACAAIFYIARHAAPYLDLFWRTVRGRIEAFPAHRAVLERRYLLLHLAAGLGVAAGCTAFVVIAEEVFGGGEIAEFDLAFSAALRESATPQWRAVFRALTVLGNGEVLAAASAAVLAILLIRGRMLMAIAWAAAQAGGGALSWLLKNLFERTRPEFADPSLYSGGFSFPSGHAMGTFVFCGLGAYLIARIVRSWPLRLACIAVALAWCLVIGFSRLYLGVHYASDVAAGFLAGTIWVAVCVAGLETALRRSPPQRG